VEPIMRVTVKKWGNSASVRIPAAIMDAASLTLDTVVDISEENGRIIIEPVREEDVDLDRLLAGITADNQHDEIDFGGPVGRETL
jgi:antitoxin MazE